ncbi:hypothetical protein RIdsm_04079 [Roseovarius indicus]|uniref:Uncharacterized protein n=1 Tax=Roseovarius indicus TaxID=540747 RepID=A0A5P3AFV8_9RHOB|nr:hypothetical protein RIdsm_04079 [Roseovarius indicus]SFE14256.1 hypothetical protein SAMN04488031_105307 [Roseovarius indicus]
MRLTAPAQKTASAEAISGRHSAAESPRIDKLLEVVNHPLTWAAEFLDDSASLPALPLIFWLTEEFEPQTVLTVGGTTGTAHLAFCQAAEHLGLDTLCCNADCSAGGAEAFDKACARYAGRRRVSTVNGLDETGEVDILAVNLSQDAARREKELAQMAARVTEAGALLLYGPGLSDSLIAGVPAPDMKVLVFGRAAPQMALFLAPGAPSPLSELAALPADSAERQAFDRFLDRQGQMHRLDLMARGAGPRPLESTRDLAPPPSRHSEDVERLLAKLLELEEDRIATRRNRPEAVTAEPEPHTPAADLPTTGTGPDLSERVHDMEAEIAFLQQRVQDGERHLKDIRTSTSWRITAPLRVLVRAVRRIRGR